MQRQRYPLVMHTGEYPAIQSVIVPDAETEERLTAEGWSLQRPPIPDSDEITEDPLAEAVDLLGEDFRGWAEDIKARVAHLEGLAGVNKRKPGRPRKSEG